MFTFRVWILGLCLLLTPSLGLSRAPHELDPLWEEAHSALTSQNHPLAAELYTKWIAKADTQHVRSPDAYFNLALAEWGMSLPGRSIFHFIQSALLITSPLQNLRNLDFLSQLEREAGIKISARSLLSFQTRLIMNQNVIVLFCTIGFWIFVVACILRWWREERGLPSPLLRTALVIPAFFWFAALLGYVNLKLGADFAVLENASDVPVLSQPGASEKLVELPPGTIVMLGKTESNFVQIVEPISGWVKNDQAQLLQFPVAPAPDVAVFKK